MTERRSEAFIGGVLELVSRADGSNLWTFSGDWALDELGLGISSYKESCFFAESPLDAPSSDLAGSTLRVKGWFKLHGRTVKEVAEIAFGPTSRGPGELSVKGYGENTRTCPRRRRVNAVHSSLVPRPSLSCFQVATSSASSCLPVRLKGALEITARNSTSTPTRSITSSWETK